MARILDRGELEEWLTDRSTEVSAAIAARSALRVLPLIATRTKPQRLLNSDTSFLPFLRAVIVPSAASKFSTVALSHYATAAAAWSSSAAAVSKHPAYSSPAAAAVAATDAAYSSSADYLSNAVFAVAAASATASAVAAADAAAAAYSAAGADIWRAIQGDCEVVEESRSPWLYPLWHHHPLPWVTDMLAEMHAVWAARETHWQVFLDWYQDRIDGDQAAEKRGRPSIQQMEVEIGSISDRDWKRGSKHVFRMIREIQERYWHDQPREAATLEEISNVASPTSVLSDGKINISPNPDFDRPVDFDGLRELPATQIAISGVLLDSLPGNAPVVLKNALGQYRSELIARGAYPVVGVLRAFHDMIRAERSASEADIWLAPGMLAGFGAFDENHTLLIGHFPLQKKADEILSRIQINENKAEGKAFAEPFRLAVEFAKWAQENGIATDDVLKYVKAMREVAEEVSRLPVPSTDLSKVSAADSVLGRPTERQRVLGSAIGFFERTYNLLGTTAGIGNALANPGQFVPLMEKVQRTLEWLRSFAGL